MAEWIVPFCTLIVVIATFVWNTLQSRRGSAQHVKVNGSLESLVTRIAALEGKLERSTRKLDASELDRKRLAAENLELMKRLLEHK